MKKALLLISLITSVNAFALVCESDENPAKKLKLTTESNLLVTGESFIRATENLYVGTVKKDFLTGETFNLFNQKGQNFTFVHKKELVINHCRARFCPAPSPIGPSQGKLSTEGLEDEYFTCF